MRIHEYNRADQQRRDNLKFLFRIKHRTDNPCTFVTINTVAKTKYFRKFNREMQYNQRPIDRNGKYDRIKRKLDLSYINIIEVAALSLRVFYTE